MDVKKKFLNDEFLIHVINIRLYFGQPTEKDISVLLYPVSLEDVGGHGSPQLSFLSQSSICVLLPSSLWSPINLHELVWQISDGFVSLSFSCLSRNFIFLFLILKISFLFISIFPYALLVAEALPRLYFPHLSVNQHFCWLNLLFICQEISQHWLWGLILSRN